jgi:hypothetical protein
VLRLIYSYNYINEFCVPTVYGWEFGILHNLQCEREAVRFDTSEHLHPDEAGVIDGG